MTKLFSSRIRKALFILILCSIIGASGFFFSGVINYSCVFIINCFLIGAGCFSISELNEKYKKKMLSQLDMEIDKFKQYLSIAGVILVVLDSDGVVVLINKKGCDMLGYDEKSILGKNWFDNFIPISIREEVKTIHDKVIAGDMKNVENYQNEILTKDGEEKLIDWHNSLLRDNKGILIGSLSSGEDITKKEKVRQELEDQQYYLKKAQEIGKIGSWDLDIKGNKLIWTDETYHIFGIPEGTPLKHEDFIRCIYHNDIDYVQKEWEAALVGSAYDIEHRIVVNGKIKWVREKAEVIFDDTGEAVRATGFAQDITYQKKTEEAMLKNQKRYYDVFMNDPRLIILVYENLTVKDCNNRIYNILGYGREEVLGKNVDIFFNEFSISQVEKILDRLFHRGGTDDEDFVMVKKDGEVIDVSVKSVITTDEDGRRHMMCFIADITSQKEAERKLLSTASNLKQSNRELEQFAYVASHDLQEPLRVISSYCQLLKENNYDILGLEDKKYLDYTIDASLRMKTLIKELLDYSRVGRKDKPFEKIDLEKLLDEVLNDFEVYIKETKATIIVEDDMPVIFGIKFRMKQLLHNIISNSLKFRSDKKPEIRIGCCDEQMASHWLFYIKDNGVGISPEYHNRIFGIFKRLYSREEYPGTGVGLALCKRIVEAHNGKIWVDSDEGNGTYVYFTIERRDFI